MKKCRNLLPYLLLFLAFSSSAQNVGINSTGAAPSNDAILDISSTDKGLLIPRVDITDLTTIAPITGGASTSLLVYNTNTTTGVGFYYWNGTVWVGIATGDDWHLSGNTGTTSGTDFLGTLDAQDVDIRTNNVIRVRITQQGQIEVLNTGNSVFIGEDAGANDDLTNNNNVFVGYEAGEANTTGFSNVAVGYEALTLSSTGLANTATGYQAMRNNTTGRQNVANGYLALRNNTTGRYNSAIGYQALRTNSTGLNNVANGSLAMYSNSTGYQNTAIGSEALRLNTTGRNNIAVGYQASFSSGASFNNVAIGYQALYSSNAPLGGNIAIGTSAMFDNTTGSSNVAIGFTALGDNTTGYANVAVGNSALHEATTALRNTAVGQGAQEHTFTGIENTAIGFQSLTYNTTGSFNTASGMYASYSLILESYNTSNGYRSIMFNEGDNNTAIGAFSYTTPSIIDTYTNSTAIGANSVINASNKIRLGDPTVTLIEGPVVYTVSDKRFKSNIKEEVHGLDFIMDLRPVVYNFESKKFDDFLLGSLPDSIRKPMLEGKDYEPSTVVRHSGFIAQEVEAIAESIGYNFNGVHSPAHETDNYSLSYSQFVVPLVKGMQEQQDQIEELKNQLDEAKEENESLKERLKKIEDYIYKF